MPSSSLLSTPEWRLLLLCARTELRANEGEQLSSLLDAGVDFPALLRLAERHETLPLLHRHLKDHRDGIPSDFWESLQSLVMMHDLRSRYLIGELLKLLSALARQGIAAVPFKGPVLATQAYCDAALRTFSDLDVLIFPQHCSKAFDVLEEEGYRPEESLDRWREGTAPRDKKEIGWSKDRGAVNVDLHWRLIGSHEAGEGFTERAWDRLVDLSLAGRTVPSLSHEDLFVYLSVHGTVHGWQKLKWVCDLAELLRRQPNMDWDNLFSAASRIGAMRRVRLALLLSHELLNAPLPESERETIKRDIGLPPLFEKATRAMETPPTMADLSDLRLRSMDHATDKARFGWWLARIALTPNEEDARRFSLPRWYSPLYYLLRPYRLIKKYGNRGRSTEES